MKYKIPSKFIFFLQVINWLLIRLLKVLAVEALEVLEKDIKGLKKRERTKEEKSLKLKTLCNTQETLQ